MSSNDQTSPTPDHAHPAEVLGSVESAGSVEPQASVGRRAMLGLAGLAGVAGMAMLAGKAGAGPLQPPAGPITSTGKTLTELEPRRPISTLPFTITQPGSYYLTSDMQLLSTTIDLITISSDNVTIDLNGFTISGGRTGIISSAQLENVTIRNGAIRNTAGSGIFLQFARRAVCSDLLIEGHTDAGLFVQSQALLERITAVGRVGSTTSSGIVVGAFSRLVDCQVNGVELDGIHTGINATLDRCQVHVANGVGVVVGEGSSVTNLAVRFIQGQGLVLGPRCSARGIHISEVTTAVLCGFGSALDHVWVQSCTMDGFSLLGGFCTFSDCHALFVFQNGFNASGTSGNTFDRCSAKDCELNAFQIGGGSLLRGCLAQATGNLSTNGSLITSGIILDGNDNVVENCRLIACGYPVFIVIGRLRNVVFGNHAVECTNSYVNNGGPTNVVGTIRTGVAPVNASDNFFVT